MVRISAITGVLLFATLLSTQTMAARAKTANSAAEEVAIQTELDQQVAAWNQGDLKGYMQGYWHSRN